MNQVEVVSFRLCLLNLYLNSPFVWACSPDKVKSYGVETTSLDERGQGTVDDFAYLVHTMVNTQTLFMNPTWRIELGLDNLDFNGMRNRFEDNIGSIEEFQISCN